MYMYVIYELVMLACVLKNTMPDGSWYAWKAKMPDYINQMLTFTNALGLGNRKANVSEMCFFALYLVFLSFRSKKLQEAIYFFVHH